MSPEDFFALADGRRGHFLYESGYHSDLWFDLETLFRRPTAVRPFVVDLCRELTDFKPDVISGALIEGAFVALLVASELKREFVYALRFAEANQGSMFPVSYEVPKPLEHAIAGKRVALVNDVISAGSAVRGVLQSLRKANAEVVCIASLVVLGETFVEFARQQEIPLRTLLKMPNEMWKPEECPLCRKEVPLQRLADH
jgi:orotate phosphoribosyltransferase